MFLFTTPAASRDAVQPGASPVLRAIADGASRTGTDFEFLVKTAQRESALDPNAKARTSSATGLFQFIEQTWLGTLKSQGANHGLGRYSEAIQAGSDGRLQVADPQMREQILDLRRNPVVSAVMAGELTQKNRETLRNALGREPGAGDLYAAHVLGAKGATELARAVQSNPEQSAARLFPDAADANRGIFYDKSGRARSAAEVQGWLAQGHQGVQMAQALPAGELPPAGAAPLAAMAPAKQRGLIGLFSTEGSRQPISQAVATHWKTQTGQVRSGTSQQPVYLRYFPIGSGDAQAEEVAAAAPAAVRPAAAPLVDAPLPPERPQAFALLKRLVSGRPVDLSGRGGRT